MIPALCSEFIVGLQAPCSAWNILPFILQIWADSFKVCDLCELYSNLTPMHEWLCIASLYTCCWLSNHKNWLSGHDSKAELGQIFESYLKRHYFLLIRTHIPVLHASDWTLQHKENQERSHSPNEKVKIRGSTSYLCWHNSNFSDYKGYNHHSWGWESCKDKYATRLHHDISLASPNSLLSSYMQRHVPSKCPVPE